MSLSKLQRDIQQIGPRRTRRYTGDLRRRVIQFINENRSLMTLQQLSEQLDISICTIEKLSKEGGKSCALIPIRIEPESPQPILKLKGPSGIVFEATVAEVAELFRRLSP